MYGNVIFLLKTTINHLLKYKHAYRATETSLSSDNSWHSTATSLKTTTENSSAGTRITESWLNSNISA